MSPFLVPYGDDALSVVDMMVVTRKAPRAKYWIQESQDIFRALKDNIPMAQNLQNLYTDHGWVEINFEVDNLVYLHLQP